MMNKKSLHVITTGPKYVIVVGELANHPTNLLPRKIEKRNFQILFYHWSIARKSCSHRHSTVASSFLNIKM